MTNKIQIGGESKSIRQWSMDKECPVSMSTIYSRLERGWSPLEAIFKPANGKHVIREKRSLVEAMFEGKMHTTREISDKTGFAVNTIRYWLRHDKPIRYRGDELKDKPKPPPYVPNETPEEYQLKNMRLSMSDIEIEAHLMRGMA